MDDSSEGAQFFDALAHPVRIKILKALQTEALTFADLKKRMDIESSGHLQHHLGKLNDLIQTDETGKYCLSDQGKDALFTVKTVENTAATSEHPRKAHLKTQILWNALVVSLLAVSLVSGLYISNAVLNQGQFFMNVVRGTPLEEGAQMWTQDNIPLVIPVGRTLNYTVIVWSELNPPAVYNQGWYFVDVDAPQPEINNTYYHVGFLGYHVEFWGEPQNLSETSWVYYGRPVGPSGWNGEEVSDPYHFPFQTKPLEPMTSGAQGTIHHIERFIIPITLFGNYTFRMTNVGNTTVKILSEVWISPVTVETRPLNTTETFSAFVESPGAERVVQVWRQPTPASLAATLITAAVPIILAGSCLYLINRTKYH